MIFFYIGQADLNDHCDKADAVLWNISPSIIIYTYWHLLPMIMQYNRLVEETHQEYVCCLWYFFNLHKQLIFKIKGTPWRHILKM